MHKVIEDEVDLWHNEYPVCPHCGYIHEDDYIDVDLEDLFNQRDIDWVCDSCGKTFSFRGSVEITYTTLPTAAADEPAKDPA